MSDHEFTPHPILKTAWKLYAELDANSTRERDTHYRFRKWVAVFAVIATFLAIIVDNYAADTPYWAEAALRALLILAPIMGSIMAAFSNRFQVGYQYLSFRAAAEEVLKEIYIYRTIMKTMPYRYKWLNERLTSIQRRLHKSVGGDMVLKPYDGKIPPYYNPGENWSDPGFVDLDGENYFSYRLEEQLAWHIKKNNKLQTERKRLQWAILSMGGLGALLAGLNGIIEGTAIWVAFSASITAALVGWEELRSLDNTVSTYSRVILELTIIRDRWLSLEPDERTIPEFFKMVHDTEKLLWDQNVEYINAMRESLSEILDDERNLVEDMINMSVEANQKMQDRVREEFITTAQTALDESVEVVGNAFAETFDGTWDGDREPPEVVYAGIDDLSGIIEENLVSGGVRSLIAVTPQEMVDAEDEAELDEMLADIPDVPVEDGESDGEDELSITSQVKAALKEAKKARATEQRPEKAAAEKVPESPKEPEQAEEVEEKSADEPAEEDSLSDDIIAQAIAAAQEAAGEYFQDDESGDADEKE